MSNLVDDCKFQGLKVSRSAPAISHLFYADDITFFGKCWSGHLQSLQRSLDTFSALSNQVISLEKSHLCFSPNTPMPVRTFVTSTFRVSVGDTLGKYLGVYPDPADKQVIQEKNLISRVEAQANQFSKWGFNQSGKIVLINAVIVASLNHYLACFRLRSNSISKLNSVISRFFWGKYRSTADSIHWMRKEDLMLPKCAGGLGIRNIDWANSSMLTKTAWRVVRYPGSLLSKLYQAKYGLNPIDVSFPNRRVGNQSLGWRSISSGLKTLRLNAFVSIGDGRHTSILQNWVPGGPIQLRLSPTPLGQIGTWSPSLVSDLIDGQDWNYGLLQSQFDIATVNRIRFGVKPQPQFSDKYFWASTSTGAYTTKSGYFWYASLAQPNVDFRSPSDKKFWAFFWALSLPERIKLHSWKLVRNITPTLVNLHKRTLTAQTRCSFCLAAPKTISHLFRDCPVSSRWWSAILGLRLPLLPQIPFDLWLKHWVFYFRTVKFQPADNPFRSFLILLWVIWLARNKIAMQGMPIRHLSDIFTDLWATTTATAFIRPPSPLTSLLPLSDAPFTDSDPSRSIMVYSDAAYQSHTRTGAIAWTVFQHQQQIFGHAIPFSGFSPAHLETLAWYQSLLWVSHMGFTHVQFHTDLWDLRQWIRGSRPPPKELFQLVHAGIRLQQSIPYSDTCWVMRAHLDSAHQLARECARRRPSLWQPL